MSAQDRLNELLGPTLKGFLGESIVAAAAKLRLPTSVYPRFHNVTLPVPDGTTQVDHVFVSRFGVFVVETKNLGGWIFGCERDRRWTQVFPGGRKSRFQNPLRQNHRHVRAVEAALDGLAVPSCAVKSVIALVGAAELKTALPANVTVRSGFVRHIQSFTRALLSDRQVRAACEAIRSARLAPSLSTRRNHIRGLRSRTDPSAPRNCPRCGKDMVLRKTRKGPNAGRRFWGCAGFPSCRAMQPAD